MAAAGACLAWAAAGCNRGAVGEGGGLERFGAGYNGERRGRGIPEVPVSWAGRPLDGRSAVWGPAEPLPRGTAGRLYKEVETDGQGRILRERDVYASGWQYDALAEWNDETLTATYHYADGGRWSFEVAGLRKVASLDEAEALLGEWGLERLAPAAEEAEGTVPGGWQGTVATLRAGAWIAGKWLARAGWDLARHEASSAWRAVRGKTERDGQREWPDPERLVRGANGERRRRGIPEIPEEWRVETEREGVRAVKTSWVLEGDGAEGMPLPDRRWAWVEADGRGGVARESHGWILSRRAFWDGTAQDWQPEQVVLRYEYDGDGGTWSGERTTAARGKETLPEEDIRAFLEGR